MQLEAAYALARITNDSKLAVKIASEAAHSKNQTEQERGMQLLRRLGVVAKEARAILIDMLDDKQLRDVAARMLTQIGRPAVPDLITAMDDKRVYVRIGIVHALTDMGPEAKDALITLKAKAKSDSSATVRGAAAKAIEKIEGK